MTAPVATEAWREWYLLTWRHLRMASRLLDGGYHDGAIFYTYHAFECAISAVIAQRGFPVPPAGQIADPTRSRVGGQPVYIYRLPDGTGRLVAKSSTHTLRFVFFDQVTENDRASDYHGVYRSLRARLTTTLRNDALYYDTNAKQQPYERFDRVLASDLLKEVHGFTHTLRRTL